MPENIKIAEAVEDLYQWIDNQVADKRLSCEACGRCCDFEAYGHKLFVTTPELVHLRHYLSGENIKSMTGSRCPYQYNNKCSIHRSRFASCRIFNCSGVDEASVDFQSELSEQALAQLKNICATYNLPYRYTELSSALNRLATV
jgi:Fe-S-cluster containining protein